MSLLKHLSKRYYAAEQLMQMRQIEADANKISTEQIKFKDMTQFASTVKQNKSNKLSSYNIENILIQSGKYSLKEIRQRIAKSILCLQNLPYNVYDTPSIKEITQTYLDSYQSVYQFGEINNIKDQEKFVFMLKGLLKRHKYTIVKLSFGLIEKTLDEMDTFNIQDCPYLNEFVDNFVTLRVGTRIIAAHQLCTFDVFMNNTNDNNNNNDILGIFNENCDIIERINVSINDATTKCKSVFGTAPNVIINDRRRYGTRFTYIPEHIHVNVFEILKNSMRAVCENNSNLDDINIIICDFEDGKGITMKISDKGGGISKNELNNIWLYSYTNGVHYTKEDKLNKLNKYKNELKILESKECNDYNTLNINKTLSSAIEPPMFGLGYGLPIVNAYCKYFGGYCNIHSVHGYGTDAYLFLQNLNEINKLV